MQFKQLWAKVKDTVKSVIALTGSQESLPVHNANCKTIKHQLKAKCGLPKPVKAAHVETPFYRLPPHLAYLIPIFSQSYKVVQLKGENEQPIRKQKDHVGCILVFGLKVIWINERSKVIDFILESLAEEHPLELGCPRPVIAVEEHVPVAADMMATKTPSTNSEDPSDSLSPLGPVEEDNQWYLDLLFTEEDGDHWCLDLLFAIEPPDEDLCLDLLFQGALDDDWHLDVLFT